MEKYNAETMRVVPKYPTDGMCDNGVVDLPDGFYPDIIYNRMLDAAPEVEPIVPLSEVLELLDKYIGTGLIKQELQQKYEVSE